jgi:hypothetical protein
MAAFAALAALAATLPASATVLYSTDFASPTFTNGSLAGQDGWGVFTPNGDVTVQDTVTDDGEPAVDLGSKGVAYYLYGPITPTGSITISMDIYLDPTGPDLYFAAIGGASNFDASNFESDIAALIEVDARTFVPGPTSTADLGSVSSYTWYDLSMTLDYATQTYDASIASTNGQMLESNIPFCGYETNSITCTGAQTSQFEGIEVYNNQIRSGAIYLGDVSISEVPEPTTWAMMLAGFALTGLALRRRSRPLAA